MPTLPLLMNLLKMLFEFVVCCRLVKLVELVGGGAVCSTLFL